MPIQTLDPDTLSEPESSEFDHLELLPANATAAARLIERGVPEWQLLGRPKALDDAFREGFTSDDPPPVTQGEIQAGTRPLLFMDFDGVFSPLPTTFLDDRERGRLLFRKGDPSYVYFVAEYGIGAYFWVSCDLVAAAGQLAQEFDIVWASTWLFVCQPLGSLVGWPLDLPWVDLGDRALPELQSQRYSRPVGREPASRRLVRRPPGSIVLPVAKQPSRPDLLRQTDKA